jgi:hypothetical protein
MNLLLTQHKSEYKKEPKYKLGDILYKNRVDTSIKDYDECYVSSVEIHRTQHSRVDGYGYYPVYTIKILNGYANSVEVEYDGLRESDIEVEFFRDKKEIHEREIKELIDKIEDEKRSIKDMKKRIDYLKQIDEV